MSRCRIYTIRGNSVFMIFSPFQSPPGGLLLYCLGIIIGCLCALTYASAAIGDLPSVLITLPMDMKNLTPYVSTA